MRLPTSVRSSKTACFEQASRAVTCWRCYAAARLGQGLESWPGANGYLGRHEAAGLFVILTATALRTRWVTGAGRPPSATTAEIGRLFMTQYLLPFEAASILLLVALMGAAMIVRRKKDA